MAATMVQPHVELDMNDGYHKDSRNSQHAQNDYNQQLVRELRESTDKLAAAISQPRSSIGIATAWGIWCFAMPNFVVGIAFSNIIPFEWYYIVLGPSLIVAGLGQFIAGLFNMAKGDTFGAIAQSGYGAYWLLNWYNSIYIAPILTSVGIPAAAQAQAFGYCLIPWLISTTFLWFASFRMALADFVILGWVEMIFICFITWEMDNANMAAQKSVGATALGLTFTAWYIVAAVIINGAYNAEIIPLGGRYALIKSWPHAYGSDLHLMTNRMHHQPIPDGVVAKEL